MNKKCQHEWVYSPVVITTNPPIYTKICRLCGKKEEERGIFRDLSEYSQIEDRVKK